MIVAIDGPAASGKSTAAIGVAKALNITHLDTGSMYRAVTLGLIDNQIDFKDSESINIFLESLELKFSKSKKRTELILNDKNVTELVRTNNISANVSEVSALKVVREFMVKIQREMACDIDCVLEGRDIGTVVFPNADYKFFMTANIQSRAGRRLIDLVNSGYKNPNELNGVLEDLKIRDHKDATRDHSPLKKAKDASVIDTTHLAINEVIEKIVNKKKKKRTLY